LKIGKGESPNRAGRSGGVFYDPMPVVLDRACFDLLLDPGGADITELLKLNPAQAMKSYPARVIV
jgi:hypothetical protein